MTRRPQESTMSEASNPAHDPTVLARFWAKVRKADGCWPWLGARNGQNYGVFHLNGRAIGAHRFAYMALVAPIPDGMFICHHCDNPSCVNPAHLFVGSNKANMVDCAQKGRVPQASVTPDEVVVIRAEVASGESRGRLA